MQMPDGPRSSPSDELLDKARKQVTADPTSSDDFVPISPIDAYSVETLDDDLSPSPGTTDPSGDAQELSAADIAAELFESQRTEDPVSPEPVTAPDSVAPPSDAGSARPDRSDGMPASPQGSTAPRTDFNASSASADQDPEQISTSPRTAESPTDPPVWGGGDRWSTPTPEWEARPVKAPRRSVPLPRKRLVISLIVFGIMSIGFIGSFLDGRESIFEVAVGDCFTAGDALEIDQVPVVSCVEEHDSELFARVTITEFGSTHPDENQLFEWLFGECVERFPAYVGEPYEESQYWIDMFIPTVDGWSDGDRAGLCTVIRVDDDLNVRTVVGSARGDANNA
jgi:hypothetical protein